MIFLSGGTIDDSKGVASAQRTALVYSIKRDKWQSCRSMNRARFNHSSCALDSHVYVFAGKSSYNEYEGSIERLRAG